MSDLTVTKIRFGNGTWEGVVQNAKESGLAPDIQVMFQDQPLDGVAISEGSAADEWLLRITVPAHAIADGVQTFVITEGGSSDQKLASFSLIAGEAAADDMRAEIELLRAELDMLKRAFRRHCLETT
ncbi:hypothetical protein PH5382_00921 [Phaeobacter sp. CECT 5382]|uniref:hypothetical protein n=1 Tax=Phaeobacter sp. CECT 5382 TaxID=1712645 RepID=UPI0006DA5F23|nr:hypothetical protein [Phaeobacter sp. CECT 5382]CUH87002.1 hypothetical protein PH5382_00921 [Phaeobacter sp. CECT 5382]